MDTASNGRATRFGRYVMATSLVALLALVTAVVGPARAASDRDVVRLGGTNRYETAAVVSSETFEPGIRRVFLATGSNFPDALAAVPIAGSRGYPILLVRHDGIPDATAAELDRLEPRSITILGGERAVSSAVREDARRYTGGPVRRVAGPTRYYTAAKLVGNYFGSGVPVVYVATGTDSADSLAGGPAAIAEGGPLLLVKPKGIPAPTASMLDKLDPDRIVVLGGPRAVSPAVEGALADYTDGSVTRLSGDNRYGTAAAIVHEVFPGVQPSVWTATGTTFPDGLTGGVAAALDEAPLVSVRPDCVPDSVLDELERMDLGEVTVLGGPGAVSDAAAAWTPCKPGIGVKTSTIVTDLDAPWDVVFTPDERTFLTERDNGRVLELSDDGSTREVISFPTVDNDHEGGLTGLAVAPGYDPDDPSTQYLYALYVHEVANGDVVVESDQRVVRFHPDGSGLEKVITGLPHDGEQSHFAGRIEFGPDDKLWVSIGDIRDVAAAQDPSSLKGKILRFEEDGTVPDDNPFGPDNPVWALGFRDPQGMAWDAEGRMYASEFGPDRDDEINRIEPGANYGWPCVTGRGNPRATKFCDGDLDGLKDPIVVRDNLVASWSGASVLTDGAIPEWEGDLFVAALRGQRLYRVDLDDRGDVQDVEELLVGQYGRLRHAVPAPDGSLWILTSNQDDNGDPVPGDDRIVRLGP